MGIVPPQRSVKAVNPKMLSTLNIMALWTAHPHTHLRQSIINSTHVTKVTNCCINLGFITLTSLRSLCPSASSMVCIKMTRPKIIQVVIATRKSLQRARKSTTRGSRNLLTCHLNPLL